MSKRKATEPVEGGKAAGKRRAEDAPLPSLDPDDSADQFAEAMLGDGADLTEVVDNADALAGAVSSDAFGDAFGDEGDGGGEDECDDDALLAAALGDDDADGDDDAPESEALAEEGPALPEAGELPDGVTEESLGGEEVDLSACEDLTLAEARRVAQVLVSNDELTTVKVGGSELAVGDMREEGELEWDSEEYTDVEAIIIAELLKANTSVARLDLARNQIGDAGATALAQMLGCNSTIEYLNLEGNTIGERGGTALLEALDSNTSVQYLNLMYNTVPSALQGEIRQKWQASNRGVGLHL